MKRYLYHVVYMGEGKKNTTVSSCESITNEPITDHKMMEDLRKSIIERYDLKNAVIVNLILLSEESTEE